MLWFGSYRVLTGFGDGFFAVIKVKKYFSSLLKLFIRIESISQSSLDWGFWSWVPSVQILVLPPEHLGWYALIRQASEFWAVKMGIMAITTSEGCCEVHGQPCHPGAQEMGCALDVHWTPMDLLFCYDLPMLPRHVWFSVRDPCIFTVLKHMVKETSNTSTGWFSQLFLFINGR